MSWPTRMAAASVSGLPDRAYASAAVSLNWRPGHGA
jgi:hypothetical protein